MKRFIQREHPKYTVLRIIPHRSVGNNTTRKLQHALHELFSVKHAKYPWQHRKGLYVAIRPAPDIWWITKMRADEDGGKHIEFFVAMPTDFVDAFKTKFRNHEKWKSCTLEEIPDADVTIPNEKNTELYTLKYKRHSMFSLSYNYAEQQTPIRDILGVTNELKAGESVNIFVRCEPLDRGKWKRIADYAWNVWDKGGMPYPPGFNLLRAISGIMVIVGKVLAEVKWLLDDVMTAIERCFFKDGGEQKEREKIAVKNPDREELLVNGKLSEQTGKKRNLPVFRTSIRYSVTSPDKVRREMLARSVANAYADLNGDNLLEMVRVNIRAKEHAPMLMSVDEVGKLTQLPTAELQAEFHGALASNQRIETELPADFLDDSGILVGTATERGVAHNVYIPTKNPDFLFTPRIINGSPRMGKDQHVINLVVEAKRKHNIGAVILDVVNERNGHRGMGDAVRDHLPPEDVLDFDLGNTDYPIYLGLESIVRNIPDKRIAADRIAEEITAFILADGDEDKIQTGDYAREAAKVTSGDLLGMKLLFTSQKYRRQKIAELDGVFDMDIWRDFDSMTEKSSGKQMQIAAPILRRIGQIMNSEFMRPIFCQTPNPAMDLYRWIDEGKVVIFRVPTGHLSERAVQIICYWIVLNVFLVKLALGGKSKAAGTYLVLNEPHQFLSDGLVHFMERMLSEGPKYRLAPIIVFHHFAQFRRYPGFVDMMMAASANWHIFKNTNDKVYERLMPYLSRTFLTAQQAFEATRGPNPAKNSPPQYIAVWLNSTGEYEAPFICDALPMVGQRYQSQDNSFLTRRHSRQYGRPIAEVLAEIRERNKVNVV